jgi:hypothetical protein
LIGWTLIVSLLNATELESLKVQNKFDMEFADFSGKEKIYRYISRILKKESVYKKCEIEERSLFPISNFLSLDFSRSSERKEKLQAQSSYNVKSLNSLATIFFGIWFPIFAHHLQLIEFNFEATISAQTSILGKISN